MSYHLQFFPDQHYTLVELSGRMTGEELAGAFIAMIEHPKWSPGMHDVWETRQVTELVLEWSDVLRIKDLNRLSQERYGSGRTAVVVDRSVVEVGANMFRLAIRDGRCIRAFRTMENALQWLAGLDQPTGAAGNAA